MPYRLAACGVTHAGPRATNEDAFFVASDEGLFVVADGMGGHNAGEVASALAVTSIVDAMRGVAPGAVSATLEAAFRLANTTILDAAHDRPEYSGMGTTVTAVCADGDWLAMASVGDSRVYRLRDGELLQMTRDDSWVRQLEDEGTRLSADDLRRHPMRHVLTEVVGVRPDLSPSAALQHVQPGDVWLLSSDGLHGVLSSQELCTELQRGGSPDEMAQRLVDRALAAGTTDNVTAIVMRAVSR